MKKLISFSLTVLLSLSATIAQASVSCRALNSFSTTQKEALNYAYYKGAPYNLGETLAAITWQESSSGKILINYRDPSASQFHILANTALSYEGLPDTHMNVNAILTKLVLNRDYAAEIALHILRADLKRFNGNRFLVWGAYNGGPTWQQKSPRTVTEVTAYANSIKKKVNILSSCYEYWYDRHYIR